jgi:hypothetical protein
MRATAVIPEPMAVPTDMKCSSATTTTHGPPHVTFLSLGGCGRLVGEVLGLDVGLGVHNRLVT